MPDVHNFNHLGKIEVACIEEGCDARGPIWEWPSKKRAKHFEGHKKSFAEAQAKAARHRAANARRLAALQARENAMAYGEGES